MTFNGVMAVILRCFTEFGRSGLRGEHCVKMVEDVAVESLRSLSHLQMSFLSVMRIVYTLCKNYIKYSKILAK